MSDRCRTRSESSRVALSRWQELSEDVQDEIFWKLPAKSVSLSRCVCKLFRKILSKPSFIKIHVNKSIQSNRSDPKLLFSHRWVLYSPKIYSVPVDDASISVASSSFLSVVYEGAVLMNYPFESNKMYHHQFLGSCDGLICFKFRVIDWGADYQRRREEETKYSVLNPLTRQFKEFTMQIVDRIGNGIAYGFGYDSTIDDYKLVAISNDGDSSNIEVYKVRSNSQTSIRGTPKYWFYNGKRSCGVFLNGCLHWLGCIVPHAISILCFDISNEIMLNITLPEIISPSMASAGEVQKCVGVLGDSICVAFTWDSVRYDVWVMQEYRVKESWINLFTTSRLPRSIRMPSWKPLLCFDDGKILVDYEFEDVLILDPRTGAARSVGVRDITMGDNRESYVETIASLGSNTYLERRITDGTVKNPKRRRSR